MSTLWTFPEGSVGHSDSVKDYRVKCSDGELGVVAWADYKPGDSYLVVRVDHRRHHVVPAGAIESVDHRSRVVILKVSTADVRSTPVHEDAEVSFVDAPSTYADQFARGMIGGGFVWPYTDV
jgi:hypothetical protein